METGGGEEEGEGGDGLSEAGREERCMGGERERERVRHWRRV